MWIPLRTRLALAVLVIGAGLSAWLFLGVQVGRCLGPLGVTTVQCVEATGIFPTAGWGLPTLVASVLLTLAILRPDAVPWGPSGALAAAVGGALGAVLYLVARPTRLEGLTSDGRFLSLPTPVDVSALAAAVLAVAGGTLVMLGAVRTLRARARSRVSVAA